MATLIAAVTAAAGRKRKCPACGHQQVVSAFLTTQPVACHRCAAVIPPPEAKAKKPKAAAKKTGRGR